MELVSKKVPKTLDKKLKHLQAKYQLRHGKRISEARIIETAVEYLEKDEEALAPRSHEKSMHALSDWLGFVKGGPKTNATEELDRVVYG